MQYCVDHPEEISKLSKVKAQVSEVKGVMMENIEKVSHDRFFLSYMKELYFYECFYGCVFELVMGPARFLTVERRSSFWLINRRTFILR